MNDMWRKEVLAAANEPDALVVFDLDSTLLDNRPRTARILREFAKDRQIHELERVLSDHVQSWDLEDIMVCAGVDPSEARSLRAEVIRYWVPRFFSNDYCVEDQAIRGAATFVRAVGTKAKIAYVSGRPEGMRSGTEESLLRHGFPIGPAHVHLFLKPRLEDDDDDFKLQTHNHLEKLGRVVAAFDNEPLHINGYAKSFPNAILVHIDTNHSGRNVVLHPNVRSIQHFDTAG